MDPMRRVDHQKARIESIMVYLALGGWAGPSGAMPAEAERFVGSCKGSEPRPCRARLISDCSCSIELLKSWMDSACRCNSRNSFMTVMTLSLSAATSREWADACCCSCLCNDATVRCRGRTYGGMRKERKLMGRCTLVLLRSA